MCRQYGLFTVVERAAGVFAVELLDGENAGRSFPIHGQFLRERVTTEARLAERTWCLYALVLYNDIQDRALCNALHDLYLTLFTGNRSVTTQSIELDFSTCVCACTDSRRPARAVEDQTFRACFANVFVRSYSRLNAR